VIAWKKKTLPAKPGQGEKTAPKDLWHENSHAGKSSIELSPIVALESNATQNSGRQRGDRKEDEIPVGVLEKK